MALLRNLCVNLQDFLCGVLQYASAQSLGFLDLAQNCSFMNWKLEFASSGVSGWTLNCLLAKVPVLAIITFIQTFLRRLLGSGRRHNYRVSRLPVCRRGNLVLVSCLKRFGEAENLLHVTARCHGIVDYGSKDTFGIDYEDTSGGLGLTLPRHDHPV